MNYPEHDKLKAVCGQSQTIGEFLEWLEYEKKLIICEHNEGFYYPTFNKINDLLAEYFGIDQDKIEAEKKAMLQSIRELTKHPSEKEIN